MRRSVIGAVVLMAGLALPVASAQATFHLEKVNELMLASAGGDSGVQFVELLDKGGTEEQFTPVFAPYRLVVYDGAGKQLGEQTLNPTGLRNAAASGTEYLISTAAADAAFGVSGDEHLTVTLPPSTGQVCFAGNPGNISCISYGSVTQPVSMNSSGTGAVHGPVPPAGESDQRQPDDSVQAATPTPRAPNHAGSSTTPGGGTSPPTPTTPPFAGVRFGAHSVRVDRRGRALVAVSCPAATTGGCSGRITLSAGTRHLRVGDAAFALSPGQRGVIAVKLSPAERHVLARRATAIVSARATATDGAGQRHSSTARLTLRR
jgi:hypothetical protein